jgi:hypothetical protein
VNSWHQDLGNMIFKIFYILNPQELDLMVKVRRLFFASFLPEYKIVDYLLEKSKLQLILRRVLRDATPQEQHSLGSKFLLERIESFLKKAKVHLESSKKKISEEQKNAIVETLQCFRIIYQLKVSDPVFSENSKAVRS